VFLIDKSCFVGRDSVSCLVNRVSRLERTILAAHFYSKNSAPDTCSGRRQLGRPVRVDSVVAECWAAYHGWVDDSRGFATRADFVYLPGSMAIFPVTDQCTSMRHLRDPAWFNSCSRGRSVRRVVHASCNCAILEIRHACTQSAAHCILQRRGVLVEPICRDDDVKFV